MRRRLLSLLMILSLVAWAAVLALWVRSRSVCDMLSLSWGPETLWITSRESTVLLEWTRWPGSRGRHWQRIEFPIGPGASPAHVLLSGLSAFGGRADQRRQWALAFPHWALIPAATIAPLAWFSRPRRWPRRTRVACAAGVATTSALLRTDVPSAGTLS